MMDPVTLGVITGTAAGAATAALRLWVWERVAVSRAREASRRDHARQLPPGSRIVDLGRHGMVIDVGCGEDLTGARR
jgi:hypothetical protein